MNAGKLLLSKDVEASGRLVVSSCPSMVASIPHGHACKDKHSHPMGGLVGCDTLDPAPRMVL